MIKRNTSIVFIDQNGHEIQALCSRKY